MIQDMSKSVEYFMFTEVLSVEVILCGVYSNLHSSSAPTGGVTRFVRPALSLERRMLSEKYKIPALRYLYAARQGLLL